MGDVAEQAAGIDQDDDVGDVVGQQPIVRLALAQRVLDLAAKAELQGKQRRQHQDHAQQHAGDDDVGPQPLPPFGKQPVFRHGHGDDCRIMRRFLVTEIFRDAVERRDDLVVSDRAQLEMP